MRDFAAGSLRDPLDDISWDVSKSTADFLLAIESCTRTSQALAIVERIRQHVAAMQAIENRALDKADALCGGQ